MAITKGKKLIFDERLHKYTYDNVELESVTKWIGEYFCVPFKEGDKHIYISNAITNKNKASKQGITNPEELRKYWQLNAERTSSNGTACHAFVQMVHIDKRYGIETEPKTGYEIAIKKAYEALTKKWDIVELERQVYSVEYKLAGHVDVIMQNKITKEYGILDWKTIEDMTKSHGNMRNEMKGIDDNALNKVSIQLDVYSVLSGLDIPVKNRFVTQLLPEGESVVYSITPRKGYPNEHLIDVSAKIHKALESRRDISKSILKHI